MIPLTLLVHDYDPAAAKKRSSDLRKAVPNATVHTFHRRDRLLRWISELEPVEGEEHWPLALIDLQGEDDLEARGEHLLATINEHPRLRDRVALVAFTRYGFETRHDVLRAMGARAILSPINLRNQASLVPDLELLAIGSTDFNEIGEAPADDRGKELLRVLATLFPELDDPDLDEAERWEEARWILQICRLDREGYDNAAILQQVPRLKDRRFKQLRDQLLKSPGARALNLIPPMGKTAQLGSVIDALRPHLDGPMIWEVTTERTRLEGAGRLSWVKDRLDDRYPRGVVSAEDDDAWIPPEYLRKLRRFLEIYEAQSTHTHPSTKALFWRVMAAVEQLAGELGVEPEEAGHYVAHAVMCLEDAEAERTQQVDPV
jgi:hypothetical protein